MDREAHDRVALRFSKMHGLGNDFVIVDCRAAPLALDAAAIRRLGDRHFGVGFDQLLTIERARDPGSAFAYGIWNTDGSRAPMRQRRALRRALARARGRARRTYFGQARQSFGSGRDRVAGRRSRPRRDGSAGFRTGRNSVHRRS
jgi:hypothetical protein